MCKTMIDIATISILFMIGYVECAIDYTFNVGDGGVYQNQQEFGCSTAGCSVSKVWYVVGTCENPKLSVSIYETDFASPETQYAWVKINLDTIAKCESLSSSGTGYLIECDNLRAYNLTTYLTDANLVKISVNISDAVTQNPYSGDLLRTVVTIKCDGPADYDFVVGEDDYFRNTQTFGCTTGGCRATKKWQINETCPNARLRLSVYETDFAASNQKVYVYVDDNNIGECTSVTQSNNAATAKSCTNLYNYNLTQYIDASSTNQEIEISLKITPQVSSYPITVNSVNYYLYTTVTIQCDGMEEVTLSVGTNDQYSVSATYGCSEVGCKSAARNFAFNGACFNPKLIFRVMELDFGNETETATIYFGDDQIAQCQGLARDCITNQFWTCQNFQQYDLSNYLDQTVDNPEIEIRVVVSDEVGECPYNDTTTNKEYYVYVTATVTCDQPTDFLVQENGVYQHTHSFGVQSYGGSIYSPVYINETLDSCNQANVTFELMQGAYSSKSTDIVTLTVNNNEIGTCTSTTAESCAASTYIACPTLTNIDVSSLLDAADSTILRIKLQADGTDQTNTCSQTVDSVSYFVYGQVTIYCDVPPTQAPSQSPSIVPTEAPSTAPSKAPTKPPSSHPTTAPTKPPSAVPSAAPSKSPSEAPTKVPTPAPTRTPTSSPSLTPSAAPSTAPSRTPTGAPSLAPSTAPTQHPTIMPSVGPSPAPTRTPSEHPTQVPSRVPSSAPSIAPSDAPSQSPSRYPTNAPSKVPTNAPTKPPTKAPSDAPSAAPSSVPSDAPSRVPSSAPSLAPSRSPSTVPTQVPSTAPSMVPTGAPSDAPSTAPSQAPTTSPTRVPSDAPSRVPSDAPTQVPSRSPSAAPSLAPSDAPTFAPSRTPSAAPSRVPTEAPSVAPSRTPSAAPSLVPTSAPTQVPSRSPSAAPSLTPTDAPTRVPSRVPSAAPSLAPSDSPTAVPSGAPTAAPSRTPSMSPSIHPTQNPTLYPTDYWHHVDFYVVGNHTDSRKFGTTASSEGTIEVEKVWYINGTCHFPTLSVAIYETDFGFNYQSASVYVDGDLISTCEPLNQYCTHDLVQCNSIDEYDITPYVEQSRRVFIKLTANAVESCPYNVTNGETITSYYLYAQVNISCNNPPTNNPTQAPSRVPSNAPSQVPSLAPTDAPSLAPTNAPSLAPSRVPSQTPSQAPSLAPTQVPSQAPSNAPSLAPSDAPTDNPTTAPSRVPSSAPSLTPSNAPSAAPSLAPSNAPSQAPSVAPTDAPSQAPSNAPSQVPSSAPTNAPSMAPSRVPSQAPSQAPTDAPSQVPSSAPSNSPSDAPTNAPSTAPSNAPSAAPSAAPSRTPSAAPSRVPSSAPSLTPTAAPSRVPSSAPSLAPSRVPSAAPSSAPSQAPSDAPTNAPSRSPSQVPSDAPTRVPTRVPSAAPSLAPTNVPTTAPTQVPSVAPSVAPSRTPSQHPSLAPSRTPSNAPSVAPSLAPSRVPSDAPTTAPTQTPSAAPSNAPSQAPSTAPSDAPSDAPSNVPSNAPTQVPSTAPTGFPTKVPSNAPTSYPTGNPTWSPTPSPTFSIIYNTTVGFTIDGIDSSNVEDLVANLTALYAQEAGVSPENVLVIISFASRRRVLRSTRYGKMTDILSKRRLMTGEANIEIIITSQVETTVMTNRIQQSETKLIQTVQNITPNATLKGSLSIGAKPPPITESDLFSLPSADQLYENINLAVESTLIRKVFVIKFSDHVVSYDFNSKIYLSLDESVANVSDARFDPEYCLNTGINEDMQRVVSSSYIKCIDNNIIEVTTNVDVLDKLIDIPVLIKKTWFVPGTQQSLWLYMKSETYNWTVNTSLEFNLLGAPQFNVSKSFKDNKINADNQVDLSFSIYNITSMYFPDFLQRTEAQTYDFASLIKVKCQLNIKDDTAIVLADTCQELYVNQVTFNLQSLQFNFSMTFPKNTFEKGLENHFQFYITNMNGISSSNATITESFTAPTDPEGFPIRMDFFIAAVVAWVVLICSFGYCCYRWKCKKDPNKFDLKDFDPVVLNAINNEVLKQFGNGAQRSFMQRNIVALQNGQQQFVYSPQTAQIMAVPAPRGSQVYGRDKIKDIDMNFQKNNNNNNNDDQYQLPRLSDQANQLSAATPTKSTIKNDQTNQNHQ